MDDERRCRATSKQSGERCKRAAIPGGRVCVMHGGATRAARAAAEARLAQAEATRMLELIWDPEAEPVTDAVQALQRLAGQLQHAADVLGARLSSANLDSATGVAWTRVVRELRMSLEGVQRLGLEEKHVQLEHEKAVLVSQAFQAVMDALALSPADRDRAIRTFLEQLRTPLLDPVGSPPVLMAEGDG